MKDTIFEKLLKMYQEAQGFVIYHSPGEAGPALDQLNREVEKMRSDYFGDKPADVIAKHGKRGEY